MSTVEEKRALLKRLLAQKAAAPTGLQHDAAGRFEPFPLTEMQRAYVVGRMDGVSGGGTSCHLYVETRLPADRLERAEAAWNRLVCHHDMLRAIVSAEGRQVVQATVPHYTFERLDLYSHDGSEAQIQLQSVRDRMISQRLPLDQWPLFEIRATLMPGGEVHLHMDFDLLLSDAAGLMALLKQWSALTLDPSLPLTPLGLCFRDLVLAERGASEADLRWWRERLPELPGRPELPRGPGGPGAFFRIQTGISAPQWERIRQEARRSGLTPAGLLLAAYAEALGREAASRRFTLTLTRFERRADHPDAMAVLGESTTTLLVPIDLRAPTFRERARAVVQALDESLAHGGVNGVSLLREARLPPEAFPCVFTSLVGLGGDRFSTSAIERGLGSRVCSVSATPQVWVDHQVFEDDGALHAFWDVREGALPAGLAPSIAERWAEQLAQLADDAAAWDRPGFRQLRPEDRALRDRVNATDAPPPEGPLHGPWLRAAGTHPRRPAVIAPDRTLSHAELLAATSSVAAALRARGLRPGAAVGVHCPKGWPQIVAALGVVRAGGAYIPLESALPGPRLAAMLEASQAVAALTVGSVPCPEGWPESVPRLDIHALLEAPAPDFTDPEIDPRDLAYVIFTSGSTGVPKGVMIEHRSALNTVLDINARYAVGPGDRVLGLSALGFDLSVWDIFGVLGAGGALVLPPPETSHDPGAWLDLMITHGVTLWNTVPALAEMLIEHAEGSWGLPGRLRLFLLSGDWVPVDLPRRLMAAGGAGTRVVSLGGATEGSIWSIGYDVKEVDPAWTSVPYGFPLLNQRWRVVDEAGEDCPLGVPGELWIGGLGVARGYMGDPQRTAERFLPGPWYRTGDQGRYRPDGSLEFLGRQDDQVKVRGHRIELGEIEASLSRHPAVSAAVAYAPLTGHGRHRHLLAAVVPSSLRAALGERPPEGWAEAQAGASRFAPEAQELDLARSMSRALPDMNRAAARWTAAALAIRGLGA